MAVAKKPHRCERNLDRRREMEPMRDLRHPRELHGDVVRGERVAEALRVREQVLLAQLLAAVVRD